MDHRQGDDVMTGGEQGRGAGGEEAERGWTDITERQ